MRRRATVARLLVHPLMIHVVVVELAVLVVVVAWPGSWWWRAPALALLVLTVVAVLGRRRGRVLYAWSGIVAAYLRRRRRSQHDATVDLLGDPVAEVAVETHVDRTGTRFGLLRDATSWTSLIALEPLEQLDDGAGSPGPATVGLDRLLGGLETDAALPASVHVLLRVLPAPSPRVDPRSPVATSYREVAGGVVAQRALLVGLRLEPVRAARAVTERGGGNMGSRRALAAATARLAASLSDVVKVRVLGPEDARAAVGAGLGASVGPVTETWTGVDHGRDGVQVCYGVTGWGADPTALLAQLSALPGILIVVSLSRERGAPPSAVLRVLCLPEDVAAVDTALRRTTEGHGARIYRLDGRHAVQTARTLPGNGSVHPVRPPDGPPGDISSPWVEGLRLPLERGGIVLGRGGDGAAVPIELFQDRPSAVSALLDPRVVMVLAFRALAVGARVSVVSPHLERWLPLQRLGISDPDVVRVFSPETAGFPETTPRPDRPHLMILDLVDRADLPQLTGRPWQNIVTVLPELSLRTLPGARAAGPLLMRRLTRQEAIAVVPFLDLPGGSDRQLTRLSDEQIAVAGSGRLSVVDLGLTMPESQLVIASTGAPLRSAAHPARPRVETEDDAKQG